MQIDQLSYGSDQSGLICGYVFEPGKAGTAIHADDMLRRLQTRQDSNDGSFVWLHFNLANVAAEKWMHEHSRLPEAFYEMLHEGSRSTRIEHANDGLIAVVNDVLHDFSFEASDIATLWLCVEQNVMISARRKPLQSVDRLRNAVNQGELFHSPTELLTHLLRDQADVLIGIVRNSIKRVDDIEDNLLADRLNPKQKPPAWVAESDVQELRQSTEEFAMVLSDMASLQERIKLLQEEIAASVNDQNNHSLFVLTVVTVLALPINIIAGLFGMNVGGVPLAQHESGFWIVVAIVATFTVIAGWLAFRRRD